MVIHFSPFGCPAWVFVKWQMPVVRLVKLLMKDLKKSKTTIIPFTNKIILRNCVISLYLIAF